MSISSINSGLGLCNPNSTHKFRKIPNHFSNENANTHSTVNISEKAMELSQKGQVDPNDPRVKAALEAIALPDWFAALIPNEAVIDLDVPLGTPLRESTHYTHTGINKKEISYCITKSSDVLCEEALKSGISSAERYYTKTSQPEQFLEYDEKLHQAVRDRLLKDDLYMEYMEYLGIPV